MALLYAALVAHLSEQFVAVVLGNLMVVDDALWMEQRQLWQAVQLVVLGVHHRTDRVLPQ
jgi:hypothetical protein